MNQWVVLRFRYKHIDIRLFNVQAHPYYDFENVIDSDDEMDKSALDTNDEQPNRWPILEIAEKEKAWSEVFLQFIIYKMKMKPNVKKRDEENHL